MAKLACSLCCLPWSNSYEKATNSWADQSFCSSHTLLATILSSDHSMAQSVDHIICLFLMMVSMASPTEK